jgi:hypothetical protein
MVSACNDLAAHQNVLFFNSALIMFDELRSEGRRCIACGGTGDCPQCFGTGQNVALSSAQDKCPNCKGSGRCPVCRDAGIITLGLWDA